MEDTSVSNSFSHNDTIQHPLTTPPPPLSMKRSSSAPSEPQGWWIGLQLNLKKESLKNHKTNSNIDAIITATIHDYNIATQESQIWINDNNNNILTDYINLNTNPPPSYNIIGNIYDNQNIFIPKNDEWIPIVLEIGSYVEIKHNDNIELEGIIDSYDNISRRYHITYNDKSEWLWCNNNNTKLNNGNNKSNLFIETEIAPPPFDTIAYGLNKSFIQFSHKMSNQEIENRKRNMESPNNNTQPPNKKRKILCDESPIRIPKMTEKVTKETTEKREIITISSQSQTPPKNNNNIKNNIIDLIDDDEEEIIVGTAQHREYNLQLMRREKER
eukprot:478732_1